ncbi:glutaredoxin 5 [Dermatophagoides farinae]|uniref:Glutaredoxin-related protein 5, mitochondrial n=1 Tax=Dermatophagoides farinae TaxID=6954 RepID=A0A922HXF2_DERFA|nr:Glutaredoxin- protein 5, mitochondrial [Dermatophagoides farinae]
MSIVQQVIRSNWLQRETIRICRQTINPFLLELQHYRYQSTNPVKYDDETLKQMIKNDKVVIFMKGVPESPRCGFSNAVVQVLRMHGVPFQAHNVLESDELRKAIKDFTSWPTIPQIFLNGEFIGGCDILLEKHQNGEFIEDLKKIGIKSQILVQMEEDSKNKKD